MYVTEVVQHRAPALYKLLSASPKELEPTLLNGLVKQDLRENDEEFAKALKFFNDLQCYGVVIKAYEKFGSQNHLIGNASVE